MPEQNTHMETLCSCPPAKCHTLSDLYYNHDFFKAADEYLKNTSPSRFVLAAVDIEHFRLFNKMFGRDSGDKLLANIAGCISKICTACQSAGGYIGGDNFAVIMPDSKELTEQLRDDIIKEVKQWSNTAGFLPAIGIYPIDDAAVPSTVMYDRATIALSYVAGNYANRICRYDSSMEEQLEEEFHLLSEIQLALEKEEFTFYAQPQCDISTGKIVGAESLARWIHSTKGMIPPSVFIPVLEKSGFIADLDRYMWKKVCEWLRSWIDRGFHPVPISINVSRIDIFSMDVPGYLLELIHSYHLPIKLLKVEITESAYAENNDAIINTVKQLRDAGFLVMMDDFGNGYSSLNMLKNVAVDILKIDMRFLDIDEENETKGIGILESVVNMARLMELPIIVEGVETQKQEKFLLNMGCRYTQGYYYYKPLPIAQFEELLTDEKRLDFGGLFYNQVEPLHIKEFLDNNLFNDVVINNILGPVAFYEMYENQIEITRVNEQYFRLAGISSSTEIDYKKKFWNHVRDDDKVALFSIFQQAYDNPLGGADGYIHYVRSDDKVLWVYLRVFFLREKDGRKIFYSSLTDMTALREKKEGKRLSQEVNELSEKQQQRLEKYYGDIPCGYGVAKILLDNQEKPCDYEIVYANHEMEAICGGDARRLKYLTSKAFGNNLEEALQTAYQAAFEGETMNYSAYSPVSSRYLQFTFYQYEYGYAACMVQDTTHMRVYEGALKSILLSYREVYFVHLLDNYCRMIYPDENNLLERGNYEATADRHFCTGKISHYDEENVRRFLSLENLREVLKTQDTVEYAYRRCTSQDTEEWCLSSFIVSEREADGTPKVAIMLIRSINTIMREASDKRKRHMAQILANMSDGFFIYHAAGEEKLLFANPRALQIYGCETMEEFRELVHNSFQGMVHPEDLARIEWEIHDQISHSDQNMDYIQYRIIRKDGMVRWIDDCGHLETNTIGAGSGLFYVFISDITDTITEQQKANLMLRSKRYSG